MPGKKTTKLWVTDDEVSPETLAKVRTPPWHFILVTINGNFHVRCLGISLFQSCVCVLNCVTAAIERQVFCSRCRCQIQGIKLMVRWLLGVKNNQSKSGNSTLRMLTAILHSDGDLTEQGKMR